LAPIHAKFDLAMLGPDDERWKNLKGGYRTRFDSRPLLSKLEAGEDVQGTWDELWGNLHHQGDVGEASYAAVPHLVRIYRQRGVIDWNTYAIVAVIESARGEVGNPTVPDWLEKDYLRAIQELAEIGAAQVLVAKDPEEIRAMLSVLALAKNARVHARFLLNNSEEELLDIERRAQGSYS
jgi:hypothetical protein